jgi:hypothetical protein
MELIQSVTVSGTATSLVEFTSIPQDASHLFMVLSLRSTHTSDTTARIRFNSVSTNYEQISISGSQNNNPPQFLTEFDSGIWSVANLTITDYTKTGTKAMLLESQSVTPTIPTSTGRDIYAHNTVSSNTAAVTSIQVDVRAGATNYNFQEGSRVALYKLTAGTGGATFA